MRDWILVALLILLIAMALGLFGFAGLQGLIWDRAYNQALSKYRTAYAHRDDPGRANAFPSYQDYDKARSDSNPFGPKTPRDSRGSGICTPADSA